MPGMSEMALHPRHVVLFHDPTRWAAVPANNGANGPLWQWGDELLVGFTVGAFRRAEKGGVCQPITVSGLNSRRLLDWLMSSFRNRGAISLCYFCIPSPLERVRPGRLGKRIAGHFGP